MSEIEREKKIKKQKSKMKAFQRFQPQETEMNKKKN